VTLVVGDARIVDRSRHNKLEGVINRFSHVPLANFLAVLNPFGEPYQIAHYAQFSVDQLQAISISPKERGGVVKAA
jgi:hypothetical protein